MLNILALATIALSAVSVANGLAIPRATIPDSYAEGYLEDYDTYHKRYMALQCDTKHGQPFFDTCCHPLLATETLEKNRPAECNPANQPDNGDDCGDNNAQSSSAIPAPSSSHPPASSPTAAPVNAGPEPPKAPASSPSPSAPSSSAPPPSSSSPAPSPSKAASPPPAPSQAPPSPPPPPAPSTTHTSAHPTPSPSPPPPPAPSPSPAPSGGGDLISGGFATFFFQKGNPGACGKVNPDSALIAAIDQARYGNSGNASPLCGKQVQITNTNNGKTVTVTVADDCPTCTNNNSIDLSVGAFTEIATEAEGMVPIKWKFL